MNNQDEIRLGGVSVSVDRAKIVDAMARLKRQRGDAAGALAAALGASGVVSIGPAEEDLSEGALAGRDSEDRDS